MSKGSWHHTLQDLTGIKTSKAPALVRWGWAPGDYICKCHSCKEPFSGDKRAITCADCAYRAKEERESRDWIDL